MTLAYGQFIQAGPPPDLHGSPILNTAGFNPQTLPHLVSSLARVATGAGDAKWLCAGDSTVFGMSAVPGVSSWPARLAKLLNTSIHPAANGMSVPPIAASPDSRWTAGAGWPSGRGSGYGEQGWQAGTPAGTLVYADPSVVCDRYDVYYLTNPSRGTLTCTATGSAPVAVNLASPGGFIVAKTTINCAAASAANSLTMALAGNGNIIAIEPWLSTTSTIRVANAGVPASSSLTWTVNGVPGVFDSPACIEAYAPDVTFIALGINDALVANPPDTYIANMALIIAAAAVSGSVVLLTPVISSETPVAALEAQYAALLRKLVPTDALVDMSARMQSWAAWNANGLMSDVHHPNPKGYWDMAHFIYAAVEHV